MARVRSERTVAILGTGPLARAIEAACRAGAMPVTILDPYDPRSLTRRSLRRAHAVVVIATHSDVVDAEARAKADRIATLRAATRAAISAARRGSHAVYVTSAVICGPRQDGHWIGDDDAVTSEPGDGLVGELVAIREPLAEVEGQGLPIAEVRLAALVGPGIDTVVTRHFEAPRILQVVGTRMRWQFIHSEDAGRAVAHVIARSLTGTFTAGAPGALSMPLVCELSGMRTLTLPRASTYEAAAKLREAGMVSSSVADLSVVVEPWPVTSASLSGQGWRAHHSNADCLRSVVDREDRFEVRARRRHSASMRAGALSAGAAIAAFSTAALVRRTRSRS